MAYYLIERLEQLDELLRPIHAGRLDRCAFDTETTLIVDQRFTPLATDSRIAGYSISYDDPEVGAVDLYCPIRHRPYDWTRRKDLLAKVDGGAWVRRLQEQEGITDEGTWADGWDPNLDIAEALGMLEKAFAVAGVSWGAHNWNFDAKMVEIDGVPVPWDRIFDTQLINIFTDSRPLDRWVPGENGEKGHFFHTGHQLKGLGETWLGISPDEEDLLKEAREVLKTDDYSMLPLRTIVGPYAGKDTRLVLALHDHQLERPAYRDDRVQDLIRKHTVEIERAVRMEQEGIGVDHKLCKAESKAAETRTAEALQKVNELAGRPLNVGAGTELARSLYQDLGLPVYRDLENTRKATLKQVKARLLKNPGEVLSSGLTAERAADLLDAIIDYRKVEKELTSFYRPLTYFGESGRIHTLLRPLQAKTTRYSAAKPNVQQMPKKGDVRKLFKPRDGHVFLLFDYGQQELRVAAHYAQAIPEAFEWRFTWNCTLAKRGDCKGRPPHGPKDDIEACKRVTHVGYRTSWSRRPARMGLVDGFLTGDRDFDPHQAMVERCHEKGHTDVDRDKGKTANFALLYGAFANKLAETLDCEFEFAMMLYDTFWKEAYPELGRVKDFIDERLRRAGPKLTWSHEEAIRTLHGGLIHLDSGYYGLNYIVQRSCREILLNAILDTNAYTDRNRVPYRQILPVHDELIFEAPKDSVDETVVKDLARTMVEAGSACSIPMIVDPGIAEVSWGEKSDLPVSWGYNGVLEQ